MKAILDSPSLRKIEEMNLESSLDLSKDEPVEYVCTVINKAINCRKITLHSQKLIKECQREVSFCIMNYELDPIGVKESCG